MLGSLSILERGEIVLHDNNTDLTMEIFNGCPRSLENGIAYFAYVLFRNYLCKRNCRHNDSLKQLDKLVEGNLNFKS